MSDPTPPDAEGPAADPIDDPIEDAAESGLSAESDTAAADEHESLPVGVPPLAGYASCEEALEDAVSNLEVVTAERDEYLAVAQRVQADFENYKRRVDAQRVEQVKRAAENLVEELLPVLDGCDAALAQGVEDVAPIRSALLSTLEKQGLERIDQVDVAFDPNCHEAVLREEGDGDEATVAEIMRTGYQWNGRVLRPAMVKVRG